MPTYFDRHWWIYRDKIESWCPRIHEPANLRTTRRIARSHRINQEASGTARDPILVDRLDLNHLATPPRYFDFPDLVVHHLLSTHNSQQRHPHILQQTTSTVREGTAFVLPRVDEVLRRRGEEARRVSSTNIGLATPAFEKNYIPPRSWGHGPMHLV
ncbi:hypothetical protein PHMEG_00019058 [Phytophthora megakarya]|uniref:Uncharacterized protein n=1 Tax=Phytophthora megakarya TaxID=4795 RepID=A0A225VTT6_9STRA|nr:hypothetical protein PHMEG_00019058 [Phytophthora megakarya]